MSVESPIIARSVAAEPDIAATLDCKEAHLRKSETNVKQVVNLMTCKTVPWSSSKDGNNLRIKTALPSPQHRRVMLSSAVQAGEKVHYQTSEREIEMSNMETQEMV